MRFYLRSYPVPDGMAAHAASVEEDGWDGLLFTDSQNLSMDVVASLHLAAGATSRLILGTAVTNLVTRHPAVVASTFATLHHVSGGRAHLGLGRGDSALELVGVRPPSATQFESQLLDVQSYLSGDVVDVRGFGSRITWLPVDGETKVPVNVFGSGPHVISAGARRAEQVTVTVGAEPERVAWAVDLARSAAAGAGRAPSELAIGAFVVVGVGTDRAALERLVRGNAGISAHFQRNVTTTLSPADARVVDTVTREYDFYHHGLEHAVQSEDLDEDFLDRFCCVGPPDHVIERLLALLDLGLDHLILVGGSRDLDPAVRLRSDHLLSTEVLPVLRWRAGRAG
jgi:5,10-methylenetetrahydromethanopterin reductase